jgi:ABC-type glycerol-3-phosphate transport system substrate-binding protein
LKRLLVKKGLLQPLEEFTSSDPSAKELTDDVDLALNALFKIDGKTWYIPHSWIIMVLYYNTKIFKDAGIDAPKPDWTWDDFLGIAKKLTTGSGADQVFGFGILNGKLHLTALAAVQPHHPAQRRLNRFESERPEGNRGHNLCSRPDTRPQGFASGGEREQ